MNIRDKMAEIYNVMSRFHTIKDDSCRIALLMMTTYIVMAFNGKGLILDELKPLQRVFVFVFDRKLNTQPTYEFLDRTHMDPVHRRFFHEIIKYAFNTLK